MKLMHCKRWVLVLGCLFLTVITAGCKGQALPDVQTDPDGTTEIMPPVGTTGYRRQLDTLPPAGAPAENPGTRQHFSFTAGDKVFTFTETETLWMYNQSVIGESDTQFLLNVKGRKVTLVRVKPEETATLSLDQWMPVYTDDIVTIYRETEEQGVKEDECMFLTLYDTTWQVYFWSELVEKRIITLDKLYQELAQMGTTVVPAEEGETLSDVITAMGANPVFEGYRLAFRDGMSYSGFLFCSPSSGMADYDDLSVLISVQIPDWNEYAALHIEPVPSYQDRLEDTGETFDGYTIWADYTGELKYFILGEENTCIWLEGFPSTTDSDAKSFTARDAAYIFELFLTK